jgi:uncharacterized protein
MQNPTFTFLPKDFIETTEGLIFAVVDYGIELHDNLAKVLCFLRYLRIDDGGLLQKLATEPANTYLHQNYSVYLHYSARLDTHLHAVAISKIVKHHQPRQRLQELLRQAAPDKVEQDCIKLCQNFQQNQLDLTQFGVTGSLLISAQKSSSDIDLVCYDRQQFQQARTLVANLIASGALQPLSPDDWQEAYDRRACSLSLAEYIWHEQRKFNKAIINGRKFDLSLLSPSPPITPQNYRKLGKVNLECRVTDTSLAFDYPAVFKVAHPVISAVVCFTATYTGQAIEGELIAVSGLLEEAEDGQQRVIVGSSREAAGEYIKIIA